MSLLAVLIALLLEQVRPVLPGNVAHGAARHWVRWVGNSFDAGRSEHGWLTWGSAVLLPAVGVWVVYAVLSHLHLLLGFAWIVVVLYLTLGFRQFSHHFTAIREALAGTEARPADLNAARRHFATWKQVDAKELPQGELVRHVIEYSVLSAHRHVFGVLACFTVLAALGLGPAGAVLYRLGEFAHRFWHPAPTRSDALGAVHMNASRPVRDVAAALWHTLDYLPARLTALGFAVVGSFEDAIDCWRNYTQRLAESGRAENDAVILAATSGALGVRLGGDALKQAFDPSASNAFMSDALATDAGSQVPMRSPELAESSNTAAQQASLTPGAEPQVQHLSSVVGLIWRMVVLWLLMLLLLTAANLTPV